MTILIRSAHILKHIKSTALICRALQQPGMEQPTLCRFNFAYGCFVDLGLAATNFLSWQTRRIVQSEQSMWSTKLTKRRNSRLFPIIAMGFSREMKRRWSFSWGRSSQRCRSPCPTHCGKVHHCIWVESLSEAPPARLLRFSSSPSQVSRAQIDEEIPKSLKWVKELSQEEQQNNIRFILAMHTHALQCS